MNVSDRITTFLERESTILPIRLDSRRTYIFPTGHGFVFLAVLLAMLIGSINYNNNLGFLLVFLLGGMTLTSIIHTYRNLLGLEILSAQSGPVFAGEDAVFDLQVGRGGHDRKEIFFALEKGRNTVETISSLTYLTIQLPVKTAHRGVFKPERLMVSCRYPLGLFRAWSVLRTDITCLVYPAPIHGAFAFEQDGRATGEGKRPTMYGVDDFQGLRIYQPGDPLRHIAWKRLSGGQGVFTKDFSGRMQSVAVFDFNRIPGDLETRLSRLCDMVLHAQRQEMVYGLALPGETIAPDRGNAHMNRCLSALALFGKGKTQ